MDEEEKNKLINMIENENENDFLDFKLELYDFKSADKKQDFLIDMMSLANSNYPGDRYIIIGARDLPKRIIKGIDEKEIKDSATYQQFINENIEPAINFEIINFQYKDKNFLIYKIKYSTLDKPYIVKKDYNNLMKGTCRIRKGSQNAPITRYDLDLIYKSKNPIKESNIVIKCLEDGEIYEKLILQKFQYSLENNSEKEKIKEKIIEANKILIDDYEYNGLIKLPTLGSAIELEEDDIKIVNMFAEENSIKINKDFFDVGDVGCFSVMPGQGNYTGTKKSIEKYEILSEIIDDVKEYYQVLEYKRNLNNLYFLELVVSNLGNSHDELVDVSIQLPKDKLILSDEFPIPEYEFLEKFKGNIIPTLYSIKESYNTSKYSPDSIINTQNHIPTPSIPIMLGTYRESYESLKEDYLSEIDDYFDYELIEHKDMIVLKHSQKLIKAKENLLFPCRIFLKEPIEIIKYTISSKFNDKIIERKISIK